jgi:hypothetical protein
METIPIFMVPRPAAPVNKYFRLFSPADEQRQKTRETIISIPFHLIIDVV